MKVIKIIATILVSVSMSVIMACSEQKTASLEGNEDIAAVIQKLPECYDNPNTAMEIYTDDAILIVETHTMGPVKLTGSKEIGDYLKERGKRLVVSKVTINSIKKEADKAHVEYSFFIPGVEGKSFDITIEGSAEMVKKGQTWKIKGDRFKY